jgi:hypothetical protein
MPDDYRLGSITAHVPSYFVSFPLIRDIPIAAPRVLSPLLSHWNEAFGIDSGWRSSCPSRLTRNVRAPPSFHKALLDEIGFCIELVRNSEELGSYIGQLLDCCFLPGNICLVSLLGLCDGAFSLNFVQSDLRVLGQENEFVSRDFYSICNTESRSVRYRKPFRLSPFDRDLKLSRPLRLSNVLRQSQDRIVNVSKHINRFASLMGLVAELC